MPGRNLLSNMNRFMKPLFEDEKVPAKILYIQSTSEVGGSGGEAKRRHYGNDFM
jgi:hypothetical protein